MRKWRLELMYSLHDFKRNAGLSDLHSVSINENAIEVICSPDTSL